MLANIPLSERPREKLIDKGAASLSDAELLAIFLRTGIPGCSAIELARKLLNEFGGIVGIYQASQQQICQIKGLGQAKYVQLQACLEMTKRYLSEELPKGHELTSSNACKAYLTGQLRQETREVFALLLLNNQHHIIEYAPLFYGTINAASVYPRVVVEKVLAVQANSVILTHNHPSGICEPSNADKQITQQLVSALALIDVTILDHIIVAGSHCYSFAEHGLI